MIIKCKMCGTLMEVDDNQTIVVCDRCGTSQTNSEKSKKQLKTTSIAIISIIGVIIACTLIFTLIIIPNNKYNAAIELMNSKRYSEAISAFEEIANYKDSAELIKNCNASISDIKYNDALNLISNEKYEEAIEIFRSIENHKDSKEQLSKAIISCAVSFEKKGDFVNAIKWYEEIGNKDNANAARYSYVLSHKNKTDVTTYKYLRDLKAINYKNTASIYKQLYKLSASIWFNKDRDDMSTNYTTMLQYTESEGYVDGYCHYVVNGGPPGEKIQIRILYETRLKRGLGDGPIEEYREDEDKSFEVNSGEHDTFMYFNMASNLIYHRVTIFDKVTGEQLAQSSIYTPYNR